MQNKIEELNPWYQTIQLEEGLVTPGRTECGDHLWGNIKKILPFPLNDMRVLDIGCNAGRYALGAVMDGARMAIGIEMKLHWYAQAEFVKSYMENKLKYPLNIHYIRGDMMEMVPKLPGSFDIIFAISSLYYLGKHMLDFCEYLSTITPNILCGYRSGQRQGEVTDVFIKNGFVIEATLTDTLSNRYLVLYRKQ